MNVNHYGSIRLRVNGSGALDLTLYSYDEVNSDIQTPLTMAASTAVAPTVLSNFTEMKAKLRGKVDAFGEWFEISQIIIYTKPVASSFPQ